MAADYTRTERVPKKRIGPDEDEDEERFCAFCVFRVDRRYSLVSARTGSILVTLSAGRKLALRLASVSVAATPANTATSRGFT